MLVTVIIPKLVGSKVRVSKEEIVLALKMITHSPSKIVIKDQEIKKEVLLTNLNHKMVLIE